MKYRNPWYDPQRKRGHTNGPEFFESDVKPSSEGGFLIVERVKGLCWDVVEGARFVGRGRWKGGTCMTQRAGLRGARKWIAEENLRRRRGEPPKPTLLEGPL